MRSLPSLSTTTYSVFDYISWTPFVLLKDTAIHLSKIVGPRYLITHAAFQIGAQVGINYLSFYLTEKIATYGGELEVAYNNLPKADQNLEVWNDFQSQLYHYLPIVVSYIGQIIVTNAITYYADSRLRIALEDKMRDMYFTNQLGLSLSHLPKDQVVVNNMTSDIFQVNYLGSHLITSFVSSAQNALFSLPVLIKYSSWKIGSFPVPDLLAASLLYALATQKITSLITHQQKKIEDASTEVNTRLSTMTYNDYAHIKNIIITQAEEFTNKRHGSLINETRSLNNKRMIYNIILSTWSNAHSFCNSVFKYYVLGWKLFSKIIPYEERAIVAMSDNNVQSLFSWVEVNHTSLTQLKAPLERIKRFLEKEEENRLHPPKLVFKESEKAAVEIKDLTIKKNDALLIAIPSLIFEKGKRYLLSGASGNGKSTLLAKIMNVTQDGFDTEGCISLSTYNKREKLIMIPQVDFTPSYSSLLEILAMPRSLPKDPVERKKFKDRASVFISESKLNSDNNATEENETILSMFEEETTQIFWTHILSGGQKKKIALISALLAEPDILLLDEIFAALDNESFEIMKNMLKKYLPNTTILIVDHPRNKDSEKNSDDFYDAHLLFENHEVRFAEKTVSHQDTSVKKSFVEKVKTASISGKETHKRSMSL